MPDLRCYRLVRVVSRTTSESITPPSSLLWAHATNPLPLTDFVSTTTVSLGRYASLPAGKGSFPTLSLRFFPWMLGSLPRRSTGCSCPFLPRQQRPSPRSSWVGYPLSPVPRLLNGKVFAVAIIPLSVQASRFARHPGRAHRGVLDSGSIGDLPAGFGAFPKVFTVVLSPTPIVRSPTYLRHRAAVAFPSEQNVSCYLPTHRICYPSESGN